MQARTAAKGNWPDAVATTWADQSRGLRAFEAKRVLPAFSRSSARVGVIVACDSEVCTSGLRAPPRRPLKRPPLRGQEQDGAELVSSSLRRWNRGPDASSSLQSAAWRPVSTTTCSRPRTSRSTSAWLGSPGVSWTTSPLERAGRLRAAERPLARADLPAHPASAQDLLRRPLAPPVPGSLDRRVALRASPLIRAQQRRADAGGARARRLAAPRVPLSAQPPALRAPGAWPAARRLLDQPARRGARPGTDPDQRSRGGEPARRVGHGETVVRTRSEAMQSFSSYMDKGAVLHPVAGTRPSCASTDTTSCCASRTRSRASRWSARRGSRAR